MAVKIRLKRVGAKNKPAFRIVVADGRSPRDGKFIEELGTYLPRKKTDNFTLDLERVRGCCIHTQAPDGRLVPFCLYNLTAADGTALYRRRRG